MGIFDNIRTAGNIGRSLFGLRGIVPSAKREDPNDPGLLGKIKQNAPSAILGTIAKSSFPLAGVLPDMVAPVLRRGIVPTAQDVAGLASRAAEAVKPAVERAVFGPGGEPASVVPQPPVVPAAQTQSSAPIQPDFGPTSHTPAPGEVIAPKPAFDMRDWASIYGAIGNNPMPPAEVSIGGRPLFRGTNENLQAAIDLTGQTQAMPKWNMANLQGNAAEWDRFKNVQDPQAATNMLRRQSAGQGAGLAGPRPATPVGANLAERVAAIPIQGQLENQRLLGQNALALQQQQGENKLAEINAGKFTPQVIKGEGDTAMGVDATGKGVALVPRPIVVRGNDGQTSGDAGIFKASLQSLDDEVTALQSRLDEAKKTGWYESGEERQSISDIEQALNEAKQRRDSFRAGVMPKSPGIGAQPAESDKPVAKDKQGRSVYKRGGKYVYEDGTEYKA